MEASMQIVTSVGRKYNIAFFQRSTGQVHWVVGEYTGRSRRSARMTSAFSLLLSGKSRPNKIRLFKILENTMAHL
jgi:hypothetical protein